MPFAGQSFSVGQILTAAIMTAIDANIDFVRNFNKGTSAPAELVAGVPWLDDSATPWVLKIYDGTDWITIGTVNASTNIFTPSISGLTTTGTGSTFVLQGGPTINSPTFTGPALGTPVSGTLTNCSGTAASLTAGNATLWNGNAFSTYLDQAVKTTSAVTFDTAQLNGGSLRVGASAGTFTDYGFGGTINCNDGEINIQNNLVVDGSLSKGSGSFKIPHPLPELNATHYLVHSFIEGPKADLIYRGRAIMVDGLAQIDLDQSAGMTQGTFEILCRDAICFCSKTNIEGSVAGNILSLIDSSGNYSGSVNWLLIAERKDQHMYDTDWTDDDGHVIVEPERDLVKEKERADQRAKFYEQIELAKTEQALTAELNNLRERERALYIQSLENEVAALTDKIVAAEALLAEQDSVPGDVSP